MISKKILCLSLILCLCVVLVTCSQNEPAKELVIVDFCQKSTGNTRIWTWLNITICASTQQQLVETLGQPEVIRAWPNKHQNWGSTYFYDFDTPHIFWVFQSKVVAIGLFSTSTSQFQIDALPKTIDDLKGLYGRPDLVGWGMYGPGYRTFVWPEKGILADVRIAMTDRNNKSTTSYIMYFNSMTNEEFTNSPWVRYFFTERPQSDVVDLLPQDPFEW